MYRPRSLGYPVTEVPTTQPSPPPRGLSLRSRSKPRWSRHSVVCARVPFRNLPSRLPPGQHCLTRPRTGSCVPARRRIPLTPTSLTRPRPPGVRRSCHVSVPRRTHREHTRGPGRVGVGRVGLPGPEKTGVVSVERRGFPDVTKEDEVSLCNSGEMGTTSVSQPPGLPPSVCTSHPEIPSAEGLRRPRPGRTPVLTWAGPLDRRESVYTRGSVGVGS